MAALVFHRAKETGRLEVEGIGGGVHVGAGGAARGGALGRVVFDRELLVPAPAVEQTDLDLVGIGAAGTLDRDRLRLPAEGEGILDVDRFFLRLRLIHQIADIDTTGKRGGDCGKREHLKGISHVSILEKTWFTPSC